MDQVFGSIIKMLEKQERMLERQMKTIESLMALPPSELAKYQEVPDGDSTKKRLRKRKNAKKVKDPNKPKHPPSGYQMFISENKEALKQTNPTLDQKDIFTRLGNEWSVLVEADKQVYLSRAAELKVNYDVVIKNYQENHKHNASLVSVAVDGNALINNTINNLINNNNGNGGNNHMLNNGGEGDDILSSGSEDDSDEGEYDIPGEKKRRRAK